MILYEIYSAMASSSKSVIPQDSLKFPKNLEALRDPSELNSVRSLIARVCNNVMNIISAPDPP